jgi:cation diffusion facilitator family transporter
MITYTPTPDNADKASFEKIAVKVSMVSIIGNIILSLLKLLAGIFGKSGAMISDAVHSGSDVLSSIIVIIGVKMSAKESDSDHPYGHERFECVAAIVLAVALLITGLFIGYEAVGKISSADILESEPPKMIALVAAVVSVLSKELMFRYTQNYARKLNSDALMADAWHHRSDALSSVGAIIGIAGSRLGIPVLDPVASIVICVFIVKAAYDIFKDATEKMVDHSCDEKTENELRECVLAQEGVLGIDLLQTRIFGSKIYVDIEIRADGSMTLSQAHAIAENVHSVIESTFPAVKHIMIHVNPD